MNLFKKSIFIVLSLLSISFLLRQGGYWLYLDNSLYPFNWSRFTQYLYYFFTSLSGETYFGYDHSLITFPRILNMILSCIGQKYTYLLFFTTNFLSSYYLLKEKFSKDSSFYGAILFSFNPISFLMLNELGFIFAYSSLPLFIYSTIKSISNGRYIFITLNLISLYSLLSYTRITGLYSLLLLLTGLFYYKSLLKLIKKNLLNFIKLVLVNTIFLLPFFFSIIFPHISGDKNYFQGIGNYAESFSNIGSWLYSYNLGKGFLDGFIIQEITGNFAGLFQTNIMFKIFSIFFILGIIILSGLTLKKTKKDQTKLFSLLIIIIFIFIRVSAHFLNEIQFIKLSYNYFPFIANNTGWITILYIPVIVYLVTNLMEHNKLSKYIKILCLLYVGTSIIPLTLISGNEKLLTLSASSIPSNYINTFYKDTPNNIPSIFYPSEGLYFDWTPYPFEISNNTQYLEIFSNNIRLVNKKQSNLYEILRTHKPNNSLSMFNLKSIFVFKDIRNATEGQFDFFPVKDYIGESKLYYKELKENPNFYTKQDNQNFAQFGIIGDDKYEYSIYAPRKIIQREVDTFLQTDLTIGTRPIVIDSTSFHKPLDIENFQLPKENKNIRIDIKSSVLNPTKYYIKLSNIDTSKPFLLQMNQTFGMSWKIKWVDKNYYDEKYCLEKEKFYKITNNSSCPYMSRLLELEDIRLLAKPEVSSKNHFEGNFVGNAWLVTPEDIPTNMKGKKELYAVIIYEKQIWYSYALIISFFTFLTLVILTILQEVHIYSNKTKYEKT